MLRSQRHARIIGLLQSQGFVDVATLSREFGTDRSTIRRDLLDLARYDLVHRTRGGALPGPAVGNVDVPYSVRGTERVAEKRAIGSFAAGLASRSDSIILDSGSTTFQVGVGLRTRRDLSIITNDLKIAAYLAESPRAQLMVTGGILLQSVYTLVGPRTVEQLTGLHVDCAFLGADAIHHKAGLTNITLVEVEVKRAMIAAAEKVILVADSSKFEQRSLAPICSLDKIDQVITDDGLDPAIRRLYGSRLSIVPVTNLNGMPSRGGGHSTLEPARAVPARSK